MIALARLKSIHWILAVIFVFALAPAAVFAQQDNASQQNRRDQDKQAKPEAAQAKPQAAEAKTEAAPANTREAQTETAAQAQPEKAEAKTEDDAKLKSVPGSKALGMSILGNQEAPTSLVIVPWKSSELGNGLGISPMLDDSRLPIDKEVFMRMLSYYEIRSGTAPGSAPTDSNAAQPSAAQRRQP